MSVNSKVKSKHKDHREIFAKRLGGLINREYGEKRGSRKNFYDDFSKVLKENDMGNENNGIDESGKKWVTGQTIPSTEKLELLAGFFNVSIDYLLGKTDIESSIDEDFIKDYTGLEPDAIRQLHAWKEESLKDRLLYAQFMQSLKALNVILCDKYRQEQKGCNGWDVLHFIGSYLISDKIIRERGYARYQSGSRYERLEKGDIVIKANTKEEMQVDIPIVTYEITGDVKKVGVYEEDNPNNRYYVELSKLYKAMSLRSIGEVLDNVIKRQEK